MAMNLSSDEQTRLNNVYNEREKALAESKEMYSGLMGNAEQLRNEQNSYLAQQEQTQNEILDKQLNYQSGLINQQKEEAAQNKRVETNKALNDYNSYINPYGIQAEKMAAAGLTNSGVSETAKLGAYNAYQNRVATAGAAYQKAVTEYDNAMNQAVLNNDVQKAQNALKKLELQLSNNRDYYSNISSLTQAKLQNQQELSSEYNSRYNTVYNQIMNEQEQAEAVRQYNEQMAFKREQQQEAIRQYNEQMAFEREQQQEAIRQFNEQLALDKKIAANNYKINSQKTINNQIQVDNNKNITDEQRYAIMEELAIGAANGTLSEDEIRNYAKKYDIKGTYGLPNGKVIEVK